MKDEDERGRMTCWYAALKNFILHPSSFILPAAFLAAALAGCGTAPSRDAPLPPTTDASLPQPAPPARRPGGYYLDDGPGDNPPANLDSIPDAVPRPEPVRPANARPYIAMGVSYRPMTTVEPYKARGLATWYGRRYHGKPTASGEMYDMYAMTAAHTTLPIPSYVRVTNVRTGRSVVVRINDRGPFVDGRLIDVSYTAAYKLGILAGATMVEVESIIPGAGTILAAPAPPSPSPPKPADATVATPLPEAPAPQAKPAPTVSVISPSAAEPLPTPPAAAAQVPVTAEGGRVFLQLGAFASRENAESYLARLKSQADWLALQVHPRDGLFRVQAGPYPGQGEARQAADRLSQALGIKAMVLTR
jgi:rare lipoprotein A